MNEYTSDNLPNSGGDLPDQTLRSSNYCLRWLH